MPFKREAARLSGSKEYAQYLVRARRQFEQGHAATLDQVREVYTRTAGGLRADISALTPGTLRHAHLTALQTNLDRRAAELSKGVLAATHQGIWKASAAGSSGVTGIATHILQGVFPAQSVSRLFAGINERATLAMLARTRQDGLKISDRVWRTGEKARDSVRMIVEDAVARGQDARTTAKQVQQYLKPGVWTAHKAETARRLGVSKDVSYEGMRLARTEMNNAFHEGTIAANQHAPGYQGVYWRLSPAHPAPDVCDDMAESMLYGRTGFYPKGQEPVRPHPQCFCNVIPAYEDSAQFTERLREWTRNPELHPDIGAWYNHSGVRQILGHASGRTIMIDTIMQSPAISKFDDAHRALIRADLERASDMHLQVVEKSIGHLKLSVHGKEGGVYQPGLGRIEMNLRDDVRENIRTFWHEFGHFIDDSAMYRRTGLKLTTLKNFDGEAIDVLSATRRASQLHAYDTKASIPDLQRFLDQVVPGKYEVRGPNFANIYLKGTQTQVGAQWGAVPKHFDDLVEEINAGLKHRLGADAAEQYLRSFGKPLAPKRSDYWIEYRTPKARALKTKPAFKGAEAAYNDVYRKYADELAVWERKNPAALVEARKLHDAYMDRSQRFFAVSDLLDGQSRGEMGMHILWGGHSPTYFKTRELHINEGWANWFQLSLQNDVETLNYLQQFAPEARRIFEECFTEMVKQTFGG